MSISQLQRVASRALVAVCFGWAGLLLGVSFVATLAKFSAPSLSLPVALDVGRHTFAVFNKVEWASAFCLLSALFGARPAVWMNVICGVIVGLLAAETFWMLPILDARVGMILAGRMPPPSPLHIFYAGADTLKLFALLAVGVGVLRELAPVVPTAKNETQLAAKL